MNKFFSIGGLKISFNYNPDPYNIFLDPALDAFEVKPFENADIRFRVDTEAPFPPLGPWRKIFTTKPAGLWTIFEDSEKSYYLISLQNDLRGEEPYRMAKADIKFRDFVIYTRPDKDNHLFPLEYPLDELAVSGHININKIGIILHSACIALEGKGLLFAGVSGSGKSTISEIWQKDGEADVLTDERVIIRRSDGSLHAFGTPWHGTSGIHKNTAVPIENIFFIRHGNVNMAHAISRADAVNRLLVRCFPTFWNQDGMQYALNFCTQIATEIKCYDLEFVNNFSVTEYIKQVHSQTTIR